MVRRLVGPRESASGGTGVLRRAHRRASHVGEADAREADAFDLVVTVALGSTLATVFLSRDVSWSEGVVALGVLALLQFVVASVTTRYPAGRAAVTAEPTVLLRDGVMLHRALRRQRLTDSEVRQSIRASGLGDVGDVAAVVLETDGTLSVIPANQAGDRSALIGTDAVG